MKQIELTQDKFAIVDDNIYEELNQYKWYSQKGRKTYYARRMLPRNNKKRAMISMHHMILGKPEKGFEIDHINGNGIDNRKCNLRFVTKRQNCQNRKNVNDSSKYPGVYWYKQRKKWCARIFLNGKLNHIGYFKIELEAFDAYKNAVNKLNEIVVYDY